MKLLFDENLSRRLVARLQDLFPASIHAVSADLLQASDVEIWEFAKSGGFIVVTADADFYELATSLGPPPKVIWLRGCDYPTAAAEELIRSHAIRIADFVDDSDRAILVLERRMKPQSHG